MSQSNVISRDRATYIGEESTFGTTPASTFPNVMTRCFPLGDEVILGDLAVDMLDVMDERVRRADNVQKVAGLKIASKIGPLKCLLKSTPSASQLSAAGTPGSLTPRLFCRHAFGVEYAAVGTTISGTASTTTVINVVDATTLKKGTWIAVQVGAEMEWTRVDDIDTGATPDAVTVSPALSAAPAVNGTIVRNLYNYARGESVTGSLTIQQGFVDADTADVTANGCYGALAFDIPEFGKLASMTLAPTVTSYTTGDQSIATAAASDEMGPSFAWAPKVYLSASPVRGTRLVNEGATFELVDAIDMVRDPGATQTVSSIVRVGGRPVAAKATIKVRFDGDYDTAFTAGTLYHLIVVQQIGTGTTASFHVWELPQCRIVQQPKRVKIGERLHLELMLEGYADTTVTLASETGDDLARIKSEMRYAFG